MPIRKAGASHSPRGAEPVYQVAHIDRVVKMPIYAAQGVAWLWLVDPDQRTLEVFRLLEGHWLLEQTAQQDDMAGPPRRLPNTGSRWRICGCRRGMLMHKTRFGQLEAHRMR